MVHMIKTALIGYGFGGSVFHAPLIHSVEGLTLSVVYTRNEDKVKAQYPEAKVTQNLEDIWNDPEIGLVVISTPNDSHVELIRKSLESGKHTVVDKPFVVNSVDGEMLIRLAAEKGLLLSVYQNRRWDNDFLTVRKLIDEKKLGEIVYYEAHYDRYRPVARDRWKEKSEYGGGTLYDLGSHLIDQALVLFGLPETVTADIGAQRDGAEGTDYFHLLLNYGKLRVVLRSGSFVRKKGAKFTVHGTEASFVKAGDDPQEKVLMAGGSPYDAGYGEEDPSRHGMLHVNEEDEGQRVESERGSYQNFYALMRDAIQSGSPVPVDPAAALDVVRVIELAERSSREGHTLRLNGQKG